eukprot:CAMPEP_0117429384 /NCGR_PEP_ID=MMETSP0758-20121206/8952_1 /TAXON_ID=63605 /ORGANISM="Percolomonas cosmopolitus, Strain AE-1 (ATCC 50343)" /LENGTH=69 /DNA_ID=CAMNT_0005216407 /DNA_START=273 /DNA_END=479 /DNA_ORIENTATION=+
MTPATNTAPPLLCHDIILRDTSSGPVVVDKKKKKDAKPASGKSSIIAYGHHASSLVKNMYEFDLKDKKW